MRVSFVSFFQENDATFEDSFVNNDGFLMLQELLDLDRPSQEVYS